MDFPALVVQWIGHSFAEAKIQVRFLSRAPISKRRLEWAPFTYADAEKQANCFACVRNRKDFPCFRELPFEETGKPPADVVGDSEESTTRKSLVDLPKIQAGLELANIPTPTAMNPSLDQLLKFTNLLHQYRTIERSLLVHKSDQNENDVEHSFTLAMLAWHIHSTYKLDLDLSKLFSYALAHDLVEIYAGDTFFYQTDADVLNSKHNKEQEAARRLRSEFPEFPELHDAIDRYEAREDDESKFIYALDKIEPVLSIYLDGGRTWKKNNVTLEMLTSMKMPKVAVDKTIEAIFKELVSRIETDKDNLFNA